MGRSQRYEVGDLGYEVGDLGGEGGVAALTRGAGTGAPRRRGSVRGVPRPPCPRTEAPSGGWGGCDSARAPRAWSCTRGKAALAQEEQEQVREGEGERGAAPRYLPRRLD